jgi:hypothetical protein
MNNIEFESMGVVEQLMFVMKSDTEYSLYVDNQLSDAYHASGAPDLFRHTTSLIEPDGLVIEFGVASGWTINHIAGLLPSDRKIFGFDSFKGLPEKWCDGFDVGRFAQDHLPEVPTNVELVVGMFADTLPEFLNRHPTEKVAFIHVDCDLYSSTRTVFTQLKDRIIKGTIINFDEYFGYPGWKNHEFRAFQEFVKEANVHYEYIGYADQPLAVRITG